MRIGIDGWWLNEVQRTGVARYLVNLLEQFVIIAPEHEYLLYSPVDLDDTFIHEPCFALRMLGSPDDKVFWENFTLPRIAAMDTVDVLLSPAYTAPLFCKVKRAVAIHDISYQTHPEWFSFRDRFMLRTSSRLSAIRAESVITISDYSKKEMVEHYGISPEKIAVIPLAADPKFTPVDDESVIEKVKRKHGISKEYVLHVGAMFVRRNLPVLLRAFQKVSQELDYQLVIVGPNRTHPFQDIKAMTEELGIADRVIFIEYADDEDMAPLFSGAAASVYLSSYEGFGFPALESLACGTPVVASNLSSIPEVVGDAGLLVTPTDDNEVAAKLYSVLTDDLVRRPLVEQSLLQAKKFSWHRTAEETLRLFERMAGT